ncbi:MAG: redoxin family protein [Nanoarchaeota archaeon]|nr:redoxin family protein [Nanoarchaeota archaeon]
MFGFPGNRKPAPPLTNITGWVNTKPLSLDDLKGKVVLLDFWTYSCSNCVRTLPHLKKLYARYKKHGLVFISVHTPEFAFEKEETNVAVAVKKHKLTYPIALDSENTTWIHYGNKYWPRQTLLDTTGCIRWTHTGEGGYEEMEQEVRTLLKEAGVTIETIPLVAAKEKETPLQHRLSITRELYCGSARNPGLGSAGVCSPSGCSYIDPGEHEQDLLYPHGDWHQTAECLTKIGKSAGTLSLKYRAAGVSVVLVPKNKASIEVILDGKLVKRLTITQPDVYPLAKSRFDVHNLVLKTKTPELAVYAFTFS